jgi:hypothetical protein
MRQQAKKKLVPWMVGLVLAAACGGPGSSASGPSAVAQASTRVVPAQFVAKMYTEVLGRGPDPAGWTQWQGVFSTNGCSHATTSEVARRFYTSSEFASRGYDTPARVLTLYRGALNREPDQNGFDLWARRLRTGMTWPQIVDAFVASDEFRRRSERICNGRSTSDEYGTQPAPTLPTSGTGFAGGTGDQLQALLDRTPAGGTVYLARKAVVRVSAPLEVPAGVTLATTGEPAPSHYALQGRLVRASLFDAPVVRLHSGARLRSLWVDGQRGTSDRYRLNAINVQGLGGNGTEVANSTVSNSSGWSNVQVFGSYEGLPCPRATVVGNLVTAYSSSHFPAGGQGRWTDGLSVSCENALIQGNTVVDATDVGIVLFRSHPAVQRSQVTGNHVISAGNSAYGALGFDTGHERDVTLDFTGTSMSGNHVWTSATTHFDIGLVVGTRPWFGTRNDVGRGATVNDNTSDGLTVRVGTGIAVGGMDDATVLGNNLRFSVLTQGVSPCPHVAIGTDAEGGNIQPGSRRVSFLHPQVAEAGCIAAHGT